MRLLVAALVLVVPTAAAAATPTTWATAVVSPSVVAHRATLTLKLHFRMQCGKPGPGPVTIDLPPKMHTQPSLAVRIGSTPAAAKVSGDHVTVQLPRQHGITCMVIGPGTLVLALAGVRNPASPGRYVVRAHLRDMDFTARLAVRA